MNCRWIPTVVDAPPPRPTQSACHNILLAFHPPNRTETINELTLWSYLLLPPAVPTMPSLNHLSLSLNLSSVWFQVSIVFFAPCIPAKSLSADAAGRFFQHLAAHARYFEINETLPCCLPLHAKDSVTFPTSICNWYSAHSWSLTFFYVTQRQPSPLPCQIFSHRCQSTLQIGQHRCCDSRILLANIFLEAGEFA